MVGTAVAADAVEFREEAEALFSQKLSPDTHTSLDVSLVFVAQFPFCKKGVTRRILLYCQPASRSRNAPYLLNFPISLRRQCSHFLGVTSHCTCRAAAEHCSCCSSV